MNFSALSPVDMPEYSLQQFYSLENGLSNNLFSLDDIGAMLPGSVMVQDLNALSPAKVDYMNEWGCNTLHHSKEEILEMGEAYFEKFFISEQIVTFKQGVAEYYERQDISASYNFFQQVKTGKKGDLNWYFTMCKFLKTEDNIPSKILLISNPVSGSNEMAKKLDNILDQNVYVAKNYKKFSLLTKREKEIISLLAEGKSTRNISEELFISMHTVETHRKNIRKKLDLNSFAELIKFAIAFELIEL